MHNGAYLALPHRLLLVLVALAAICVGTSANKVNPRWLAPSGQIKAGQSLTGEQPLKVCALTFDDGPDEEYTARVREVLDAYGVKATFFVVGENVLEYPDQVSALIRSGHEIGSHSYSHPDMSRQSAENRLSQLTRTNEVLAGLGVEPQWFRPPFGHYGREMVDQARALGMETILWSVDAKDWQQPGPGTISSRVLQQVGPGAVVLLHSTNAQTVEALPAIIEGLAGRGYYFATMSQWRDLISGSSELQRQGLLQYPPGMDGQLSLMSDPFYEPFVDISTVPQPAAVQSDEAAARDAPAGPPAAGQSAPPAAEHLRVFSNFNGLSDVGAVLAGGRGRQLHAWPAPAVSASTVPPRVVQVMLQAREAVEVQDTPVQPAEELPTLPAGEVLVLPPAASEPQADEAWTADTPIEQQWPSLPLQICDLVDMENSTTAWTPPASLSAAELLDHGAAAPGKLGLPEPRFCFLAMIADLERYTWVELATYVRLARLSGMVLPSEHYAGAVDDDMPYPWVFAPLSYTDRAAWVDLTVEDIADVMEVLKRGKRHVYIVVRPSNLHFFIAAHTWSEMNTNMSDFVLFRQATGGLSYDPEAQLPSDWTLPAGVEVGYFTDGTRDTLVVYSQSYRPTNVEIPPRLRHFSRVFIDAGGYLKTVPLTGHSVEVGRSPAILTYEYPSS